MKYPTKVYKDVKEWYENPRTFKTLTNEEIDKLPNKDVLNAFLKWNGIHGYTEIIIEILEAK